MPQPSHNRNHIMRYKQQKHTSDKTELLSSELPLNPIKQMKGAIVAVFFAVLAVISLSVPQGEAVNCFQVDTDLFPCISYLRGQGGEDPSKSCCDGVLKVKGLVQTLADKKACCNCVKNAAGSYPDLKDDRAKNLAAKCGVELDIIISKNVDCDKI